MPFIPHIEQPPEPVRIPFYEDAADQEIPGRRTRRTQDELKKEIVRLLHELGAKRIEFTAGKYDDARKPREGYQINFQIGNATGRMDCAALPLRSYTAIKQDRALAQALFLIRDKLQAMVYAYAYEPGSAPLLPYLIGEGGKTVTEYILEMGDYRPLLTAGGR